MLTSIKNNLPPLVATVLFVAMICVNALANILPINGLNTGQVSDLYPSLFTPSGITFSIWSVIYLQLLGTVIVIWRNRSHRTIEKLLPLFSLSCIFNLSWIIVWHYLMPVLSVLIMLCLLTVLIIAFRMLHREKKLSTRINILIKVPMTIYLAWISVATIANVAAMFISFNWKGGFLSEQNWTVIMIIIATLLAIFITTKFNAPFFTLVVMWAVLGIYLRWRDTLYTDIIYCSMICMGLMLVALVYFIRQRVVNLSKRQ